MIASSTPQRIELLRRRTISQTLATAFGVFQQIGKQIVGACSAIAGPPLIIGMAIIGYWYVQNVMVMFRQYEPYASTSPGVALVILGAVCALAGIVLLSTTVAACLHIYDSLGAEALTVRRVWQEVTPHIGAVLAQFLLLGVLAVAGIGLIGLMARTLGPVGTLLLFGIYFVAGWFITTFYSLPAIRVVEHAGVIESFSRAMRLARGRRWSNFGMIFLTSLFSYLISTGFVLPFYIVLAVRNMVDRSAGIGDDFLRWEYMLLLLLVLLGQFMAWLYVLVAYNVHYYNVAERTDHWRLMERISALRGGGDAEGTTVGGEVARA